MLTEGCQRDWDSLPKSDLPLVVGMDGGYVRFYDRKSSDAGQFQVVAGKSIKADGTSKCFGMVYSYDTKPQRRIFEVLKSQGMQMNQQVTFLSDGEESIRKLMYYLNPNSEHRVGVATEPKCTLTTDSCDNNKISTFFNTLLSPFIKALSAFFL